MTELKVNIKSLAAEALINRAEARKLSGIDRHILNHHRKTDLRQEARAALIAYAYLRGKSYRAMEKEGSSTPHWAYIRKKAQRFANGTYDEAGFNVWAGIST